MPHPQNDQIFHDSGWIDMSEEVIFKLERTDGEIIWRSHNPVALAQGKGTLTVQCKNLEDPSRMRLFFENDADYNMFRFMHPLYDRRS